VKSNSSKLVPLLQIAALCLIWLVVGLILPHDDAPSPQLSQPALRSSYLESRFVFADLDGDQKPDLALVEMQSQHSAKTNYSIHVKLSDGPESAINLNGPVGGLRVSARDVNGDDNVDLIVTANLDGGFIQVLLNDGRGNFSVAAPGEFTQRPDNGDSSLEALAGTHTDLATLASLRSFHENGLVVHSSLPQPFSANSCSFAEVRRTVQRPGLSRQGRSPPAAISHS
jgi:hypothetical protein